MTHSRKHSSYALCLDDAGYPASLERWKIYPEGYSGSVPSLPGCWSQGKTARKAILSLQAAVREYIWRSRRSWRDAAGRDARLHPPRQYG